MAPLPVPSETGARINMLGTARGNHEHYIASGEVPGIPESGDDASASPEAQARDLRALLADMRDEMFRGGSGSLVWANRVDAWADRLEAALASSPVGASSTQ